MTRDHKLFLSTVLENVLTPLSREIIFPDFTFYFATVRRSLPSAARRRTPPLATAHLLSILHIFEELAGLDPAIFHKLESMWQKPSGNYSRKEFMKKEFVMHNLSAIKNYKQDYFEETFSLASRYLCAYGGIKAFLLSEFKPGVKYSPKYVKWMLKSFVGADTKIRYRGELPPTLGEIGILVDDTHGQIINHPDPDFNDEVNMYVIKEQA
ncbi:hypothetical protein OROMI_009883 [Orobanche minor]